MLIRFSRNLLQSLIWSTLVVLITVNFFPIVQAYDTISFTNETVRLGFLYNITDPIAEVDAANGALNYVSPDWFGLDWNGNLVIYEAADKDIVKQFHDRGIKVVPYLSNSFNYQLGCIALANREQLTNEIAAAIQEYNLDGMNYDIENVGPDEKDLQTDFMRLLRAKLPNKHLSISVVANPYHWAGGWHGSYDMAALAKICDNIVLMSYDLMLYSRQANSLGAAVSGEDAVTICIEDLLERGVPANKLLMGIPFYGRIWYDGPLTAGTAPTETQERLSGSDGVALGHLQIKRILADGISNVVHRIDPITKSDVTSFKVAAGKQVSLVWSMKLDPGYYSIYHESLESYANKMKLMQKYHLAGYAAWAVGQEDPTFWPALGGKGPVIVPPTPVGRTFTDLYNGYWAKDDILYGANLGWLSWTKSSRFYPEAEITRAEASATIKRMLGLTLVDKTAVTEFIDLPTNYWAYTDVQTLVYYNMMYGMTTEAPYIFGTYDSITRAQFAAIIDRCFLDDGSGNVDTSVLARFSDLSSSHWAYNDLARVVKAGLLQGYPDGTMQPDRALTRAELMSLLYRVDVLLVK